VRVSFNEDKLNLITGFYHALLTYVAASPKKIRAKAQQKKRRKQTARLRLCIILKLHLFIYIYMYSLNVPETSANRCREEHAYDAFAVDDGNDDLRSAAQPF